MVSWPVVVALCVAWAGVGAAVVITYHAWAEDKAARTRTETTGEQVRPRFGHIIRADGSKVLLVFHPTDHDPRTFRGVDAATELPPTFGEGDVLHVDAIGPNQSVVMDDGPSIHNNRTDDDPA